MATSDSLSDNQGISPSAQLLDSYLVVGRGSNNTKEIQDAIDEVHAGGGGEVYLKKASYKLSSAVMMKTGVDITIQKGATFSWDSTSFSAFLGVGVHDIKFSGGSFNAGAMITGTPPNEHHCVYFKDGSYNIVVQDVYSTRIASGSIRFRNGCYDFKILNCKAENTDSLGIISVNCYRFTVRGCTALNTYAEGLYCEDIHDFTMDDLYFDGCTRDGLLVTDFNTGVRSSNGKVLAIRARNCAIAGISITGLDYGNVSGADSRNNNRDGVLFDDCSYIKTIDSHGVNNNQSVNQYCGFRAFNSNYMDFVDCNGIDNQGTATQYQGIQLAGTSNDCSIMGGRSEGNTATNQVQVVGSRSRSYDHVGITPRLMANLGTVSASPSILFKNGDVQTMTITQNTTLQTFGTSAPQGQIVTLYITQNSAGGHTITMPSNFSANPNSDPFSTASNAVNIVLMQLRSTTWYELARYST